MGGGRIRDLVAHGGWTVIIMMLIMLFISHKIKIHILCYKCHEYRNT